MDVFEKAINVCIYFLQKTNIKHKGKVESKMKENYTMKRVNQSKTEVVLSIIGTLKMKHDLCFIL